MWFTIEVQDVRLNVRFSKPGSMHLLLHMSCPFKPVDLSTNPDNTRVLLVLRQLGMQVLRAEPGKRNSAWLGHGNQWLGGQKANAIREPIEANSNPAEPAPMHRERVIWSRVPSTCPLHCTYDPASTTKLQAVLQALQLVPQLISVKHTPSYTQTTAFLRLLIRAPETEMDVFHFDFSAVLFLRKNDCCMRSFFLYIQIV